MLDNMIKIWMKYDYVFLEGLWGTLWLALITVLFGTVLGTVVSLMRMSRWKGLYAVSSVYIEVLRGTPILLQLYFFWLLLPKVLPIEMSDTSCIVVALIINSSSYVAEVIRAGIQAVDKGQMEAARSLGLSGRGAMRWVILPQAVKNILPALANEFIVLLKETSISGYIGLTDLTRGGDIIRGVTFDALLPLFVVALIYLVIVMFFTWIMGLLERRLRESDIR